jgi:RNA polymerase primary sigma factor
LTNKISKAYSQLEQEYEREPTPEELAALLEVDTEEVAATLGVAARHVSVDQPMFEGDESTLIDVLENQNASLADTQMAVDDSLRTEIERSLNSLTERQKEVLCFFFGIGIDHPLSLEDIGQRFNLTRERVRQIKDKAISKLQASSQSRLLRGFLGA